MSLSSVLYRAALGVAGIMAMGAANAGPPAAPQVTVGAGNVKQLRFDWNYVPQANYYELWFKANNGATEVKVDDYPSWRPRATVNVSLHLLDWNQARYRVKACNPSGCTATAPIAVTSVLGDALGFLKSSHPYPAGTFGYKVALSEDGNTLAVVALTEGQYTEGDGFTPIVYLMRRDGQGWRHETRILPGRLYQYTGHSIELSLSADGNRLAFTQLDEIDDNGNIWGALYVYQRLQGQWQLEQRIVTPGERIAETVKLSAAGDKMLVRIINVAAGWEHLYTRTSSGWNRTHTFAFPAGAPYDSQCSHSTLSADGQIVARACRFPGSHGVEMYAAPDWSRRDLVNLQAFPANHQITSISLDHDGDTFSLGITPSWDAAQPTPRVDVYERNGGTYQRAAAVSAGAWHVNSPHITAHFGYPQTLSSDGQILVVGDANDDGQGRGVLVPPLQPGGQPLGAAYVYDRRATGWKLRHVIRARDEPLSPQEMGSFGFSLALARAGKLLVVGDPSNDVFVPPHPDDGTLPGPYGMDSGAVWLY